MIVLVYGDQEKEPEKFAWVKTKKLTTYRISALMCFLYGQADLILVPFPDHQKQVLSIKL